jgi:REP element-mobilizing transposase RayT
MKKLISQNTDTILPVHVTSRCINKAWFDLPMPEVWDIMATNLKFASFAYNFEVHAFVLMNNHFHLLLTCPEQNLSEAMQWFIGTTSCHINERAGRINQVFARRFKRCRLKGYFHYMNTYKYIYQNPLRAKICQRVEEYPFSSLRGIIGLAPLDVEVSDEFILEGLEKNLEWLNSMPTEECIRSIRSALRHSQFVLAPLLSKRQNPLNERLL